VANEIVGIARRRIVSGRPCRVAAMPRVAETRRAAGRRVAPTPRPARRPGQSADPNRLSPKELRHVRLSPETLRRDGCTGVGHTRRGGRAGNRHPREVRRAFGWLVAVRARDSGLGAQRDSRGADPGERAGGPRVATDQRRLAASERLDRAAAPLPKTPSDGPRHVADLGFRRRSDRVAPRSPNGETPRSAAAARPFPAHAARSTRDRQLLCQPVTPASTTGFASAEDRSAWLGVVGTGRGLSSRDRVDHLPEPLEPPARPGRTFTAPPACNRSDVGSHFAARHKTRQQYAVRDTLLLNYPRRIIIMSFSPRPRTWTTTSPTCC
jgi:hypothetical protein